MIIGIQLTQYSDQQQKIFLYICSTKLLINKFQPMNIIQLTENKKQYIDLLLLADEQESMIDRYLERGDMFVLDDNGVKAVCVVTND